MAVLILGKRRREKEHLLYNENFCKGCGIVCYIEKNFVNSIAKKYNEYNILCPDCIKARL